MHKPNLSNKDIDDLLFKLLIEMKHADQYAVLPDMTANTKEALRLTVWMWFNKVHDGRPIQQGLSPADELPEGSKGFYDQGN